MKLNESPESAAISCAFTCFIQRVEQLVFVLFRRCRQFFKSENFSENRADAQHFVAVLTDPIETISNRLLDALRDHQLHPCRNAASDHSSRRTEPLLDQRLQDFFDEERIAFSFTMNCDCKFAADVFT